MSDTPRARLIAYGLAVLGPVVLVLICRRFVGEPLLGFVETDREGRFALMLPEAARARLRALHPRHVGRAIDVSEATRTLGPATLIPAGGIVGRVTDAATGKPV